MATTYLIPVCNGNCISFDRYRFNCLHKLFYSPHKNPEPISINMDPKAPSEPGQPKIGKPCPFRKSPSVFTGLVGKVVKKVKDMH